jgi:CheY-like chemotaxis protein
MVILLVEDEAPVRHFIGNLLKADGHTVLTAGDGLAALELSRLHPGPLDLLLTDVVMPRMGGMELCKTLASERPGIKVIIMSGALKWREQTSTSGFPFLQKPFSAADLRSAVQSAFG